MIASNRARFSFVQHKYFEIVFKPCFEFIFLSQRKHCAVFNLKREFDVANAFDLGTAQLDKLNNSQPFVQKVLARLVAC